MSLHSKYELIDIICDGPVKTFSARQVSTGRTVAAHLIIDQTQKTRTLLERIGHIGDAARREIIETGEQEGTPYVITGEWLRPESLLEWIESHDGPAVEPDRFAKAGSWRVPTREFREKSAASPVREASVIPAGFTQMFQISGQNPVDLAATIPMGSVAPPIPDPKEPPKPPGEPEPKEPEPKEPEPPTPTLASPAQPGEFTRLFETSDKPASPQPVDDFERLFGGGAVSPPATETSKKSPGEFTRLFQTPAKPAPPAAAEPENTLNAAVPALGQSPGVFTRMFQTPPPAPIPQQTPPQPTGPGEFTRFFQAPVSTPGHASHPAMRNPAPPPAPSPRNAPGEFTQMFGVPAVSPSPLQENSPVHSVPSPTSVVQAKSPGEYTRMFTTSTPYPEIANSSIGQQPPSPARPEARRGRRSKKSSYVPLLIILGVVFLLAITLVLFFALRK